MVIEISPCFAMEEIFYVLRKNHSLETIQGHEKSISILISQAYHIDKNGNVSGAIDSDLLDFTQKHSIKLMAMVTNSNFDKDSVRI